MSIDGVNRTRPNTLVDDELLDEDIILCCGEDPGELLSAFEGLHPVQQHEYRCYRFWRYDRFTLIWTGIGTGCLEPLLFEILEPGIIKRIILIGTAGALRPDVAVGQAFVIGQARLACTGITRASEADLVPNWPKQELNLRSASGVSTDYYYGFSNSPTPRVKALEDADGELGRLLQSALNDVEVVDMESAQFYHFCRTLGGESLEFVALKWVSNPITDMSQQTIYSACGLKELSRTAIEMLCRK